MAQRGDTDFANLLKSTGFVYGYLPDTDHPFRPIAAAAYLAACTPSDADIAIGSRALADTACLTRLLGARTENDVEAALKDSMSRTPFVELLEDSDTLHYPAVKAIAGPFVSYAPDWCAVWPSTPSVAAAKAGVASKAPPLAVMEVKGTYTAVHAAFAQAAAQACAATFTLTHWDLNGIDACVPFAATNGREEKHGLAYCLENGLPCVTSLDALCDLQTAEGRKRAAYWRLCLCNHVKAQVKRLNKRKANDDAWYQGLQQRTADTTQLTEHTFVFGDSFFTKKPARLHYDKAENSLRLQLEVFARLQAVETVAKPLTALALISTEGTHELTVDTESRLIFENLVTQGFVVGLPAAAHMRSWLDHMHAAVAAMHAAGVVHLDLHPNNTLFRLGENGVEAVRIIDLDSAFPLGYGPVDPSVRQHVRRNAWRDAYPMSHLPVDDEPSVLADWYFVVAVLLAHLRGLTDQWIEAEAPGRTIALDELRIMLEQERHLLLECCEAMKESVDDAVDRLKEVQLVEEDATV